MKDRPIGLLHLISFSSIAFACQPDFLYADELANLGNEAAVPDFIQEPFVTVRPTQSSDLLTAESILEISRGFTCDHMFKTSWEIKKTHLYLRGNLPNSNFYYVGRWKKTDANGNEVSSRNPAKNCWRKFQKVEVAYDEGYKYNLCGPFDCLKSNNKNDSNSQSAFRYQLDSSVYGTDEPTYNKRYEIDERFNCKVDIRQDQYGITTEVELRGKESLDRAKRPEVFDAEPRSIYLKCFYPTVDIELEPTTQSPKLLNNTDYAKYWDTADPGYEVDGNDYKFYKWGQLKASFTMDVIGGTAAGKDPAKIGDTVLVQIKPNMTDPDMALMRESGITNEGGNEKHYQWTVNKCYLRNRDARPVLDAMTEYQISSGAITRHPQDHPFYKYVEVEIVKENCFQRGYYARAMTKFAVDKNNQGLVVGYEVFLLGDLATSTITLDCDIKICLRDPLNEDGQHLDLGCHNTCVDQDGVSSDDRHVEFEPYRQPNGDIFPTTSVFENWETTVKMSADDSGDADDVELLTEEPRTFNFAFAINQPVAENVDGKGGLTTEVVWHTHPYFRAFQQDPDLLGKIGVSAAPPLNGQDPSWNENLNPLDTEVDIANRNTALWQSGRNDPKWYGTPEPVTYRTVTPWKNWRDGMIQHRNCSEWDKDNDGWTDFDEKRCKTLDTFMKEGPNTDQGDQNKDAADEITKNNWANDKNLCNDAMVDMEVTGCCQKDACIANCEDGDFIC